MLCRHSTTWRFAAIGLLAVVPGLGAAATGATITAVPPAEAPATAMAKASAASLLTPASAPARRIVLAPPAEAESAALKARNASRAKATAEAGRVLEIGFGRDVPAAEQSVVLADLPWVTFPDGSRAARIEIDSPGAAGLRVALQIGPAHPDLALRFAGAGDEGTVFGPYPANAIAAENARGGLYWSPVIPGQKAIVELSAAADVTLGRAALTIPRVSHQLVRGAGLRTLSARDAKAIGDSGACNVDIACVASPSQALLNSTRSVVRMSFVGDDGRSKLCTGTLLNDSVQSFTPYLFVANHCITSARTARTLNTYWFFDALSCNNRAVPPFVQLVNGAALLGRSQDSDWGLLRLFDAAPAGAYFSAWRAEPLPVNAIVSTLHHPSGDLKKWSQGAVTASSVFIGDADLYGNYTEVVWSTGTTEGGSSGSALLTFLASGGYYEVRGGLFGGAASCSTRNLPDYFSQLDVALPLLRQYLTPDAANPTGFVAATEFYNRTLDRYFMSTNPVEINNLDSGATIGWERTGFRFLAYDNPVAGSSPVCRFYRAPAYGDSHFYSASPAECAATAAAHPVDWIYESPNVFYVPVPDPVTGVCPAGTRAVYRYFNTLTTNHRYTMEITVRDVLASNPAWIPEGYGPGPHYPIMCALV